MFICVLCLGVSKRAHRKDRLCLGVSKRAHRKDRLCLGVSKRAHEKDSVRLGSYSWRVIGVYYCYTTCFRKEERKRGRNDFVRKLSSRHPETGVFGVEAVCPPLVSEQQRSSWYSEVISREEEGTGNGTNQAWCSESPRQRWQRASQGKEGGTENNVRKSPERGAGGMENVEAPTAREIDCVHIQERPAELALAGKGKFTFWAKIPFFFLNPSVAHQGAPFQPLWKKGHPGVVGLLFAF